MKFTVDRSALAEAMTWVGRAVPSRPLSPVMSGMKLTADGTDTITLSASDYETSHTARVDGEVHDEGIVLIPGRLSQDIVNAFGGDKVEVIAGDTEVTFRAGTRSTYRVPRIPLDEYPNLPKFPTHVGRVEATHLQQLVKTIKHAIDDSSPHNFIRGVRLEATEGEILGVGTNRFVISTLTIPWDHEADFDCQVPVAVYEAATNGLRGPVTIGFRNGIIGFSDAHRTVTARCIDAQYGTWRQGLQYIKDTFPVEADTIELRDAIKRAGLTCAPEKPVWLKITGDHIEVTAGSPESGDGCEVVEATAEGETTTAFAPRYLGSTLATVTTERVRIDCPANPKYPVRVTGVDDDTSFHVVMPRMANSR